MNSFERSVTHDAVEGQPFRPLSLGYDSPIIEGATSLEATGQPFTPDPNATTRRFSDGLELSRAEMSFRTPGPLSLDRDAGWLALATVMLDVAIDQNYIDHLNVIRQKSLTLGQGKNAWPDFRQALGWSEMSRNNRLLSLITVIHNMCLMYSHLGNMVMAPVTNNMVKVLERAPATFIKELDALGDPAVAQDVLINRTNLFSHNLLALLEKSGGVLPERSERSDRALAVSRRGTSSPRARSKPRKAPLSHKPKDLSFSAASVIDPRRDRTFEHIHRAFAASPEERQQILRGLAALLPGGIDALIERCPELIDCNETALRGFIELATDPDVTTQAVRKWKLTFSSTI